MQSENFYKCFEDSKALNEACVNQLESLVTEVPYFQAAWMLLAKAKSDTSSSDYHKVLGQAAARVFNREQLFDFIYTQEIESFKPSFEEKKKPSKIEVKKSEPRLETENKSAEKLKPQSTVAENRHVKEAAKPQAPKPIKKDGGEEVQSKEDLRQLVKDRLAEIEKEKSAKEQKDSESAKQEVPIPDKKSKLDIIESFIKQNPVINKPKDIEYKEELEVAKKSLDDRLDFVSETLAEINLKQGHVEKAIKIYEKLSLKYPEKSSYFAAQIKKVKLSK